MVNRAFSVEEVDYAGEEVPVIGFGRGLVTFSQADEAISEASELLCVWIGSVGKGPNLLSSTSVICTTTPSSVLKGSPNPAAFTAAEAAALDVAPDSDPEPVVSLPEQAWSNSNPINMARATPVNRPKVRLLRALTVESSSHPGPTGRP